ncbi:site-specific tyrosine recombinase XerC [Xenorhabdus nematophila]|uniref:site-specific tyrosine recombinase XerC n=1 Tax=Xenorhabdus nematophila TaxID=628 RepID=UPI0032B7FB0A
MASITLRQHIQNYIEHLDTLRYTRDTRLHYQSNLMQFVRWCDERGITTAQQVSFAHLESWQRYLSAQKNPQGYPVAASTLVKKLTNVRLLFGWLVKRQYLLYNPARDLELPRTDKGLPRHILSEEETARILTMTNSDTPLGLRDRAIMEMLWSSGIRRSELQRLQVDDVDFGRGVVFIRLGKGRKDRVVPFGKSAQQWTQSYLEEVRPRLVWGKDPGYLFVSNKGKGLTDGSLTQIVRNALHRAEVEKPGGCHLFRHAMATQMLENGADTRHIQAILGHASLETTQIYTRVAIGHLKEVHQQTHPAERDNPTKSTPESSSGRASGKPDAESKPQRTGQPNRPR